MFETIVVIGAFPVERPSSTFNLPLPAARLPISPLSTLVSLYTLVFGFISEGYEIIRPEPAALQRQPT